ncbi:calcineurin-like phosphoesterase family protein [Pseudonocardia sediminis]|uniref:Calcineurin-like phosphoesterase family protein n=1 Tax=Pseudonocardia sediminis TaxID=1397368 RepID=A0A4Q7V1P8_PSEST|nr:metallophosphoesterase [Pseudonocardia sediminis]RZT88256.1 calcineurin-like phosphoesterase family protein [Pseudonocardia sediminis]
MSAAGSRVPLPVGPDAAAPSRAGEREAGWECAEIGEFAARVPPQPPVPIWWRWLPRWLQPGPLWDSRNDVVAKLLGDPTDAIRTAWLRRMDDGPQDPARNLRTRVVDRFADREQISVALLGDPGEGDASQYVVPPVLERVAGDTDLAVVVSDVIYPAGGVAEYENRLHRPYTGYPGPIYGLPGNHDWYDDLTGFMATFCGQAPDDGPPRVPGPGPAAKRWLRARLWRRAPRGTAADVERMRARWRGAPGQQATQPGPYCAIDAGPVRLVLIDTGLHGGIDADQADWLREVSHSDDRPKILLTGKPLLTYAAPQPCPVRDPRPGGPRSVEEIVTDPRAHYIAAIGGDDHAYQRYPLALDDGRTLLCLVAGGSGAFLSATHTIPNLDDVPVAVTEDEFRCYPLRGDSLAYFSRRYDRILGLGLGRLVLSPGEASALVARRLHMDPPRAARVEPGVWARRIEPALFRLPSRGSAPGHNLMSVLFDGDAPPLFKSFLRLDATADEVVISAWSATGCLEHERHPACEDRMRARRGADGRWTWTSETPGRATP